MTRFAGIVYIRANMINIVDLGLVGYVEALERQKEAAAKVRDGGPGTLFLLEHPPVITFGRNGGEEHLPFDRDFFAARSVAVLRSSRGGSITCHFPGQLVAYPVLRIDKRPGGLRSFFADIETCAIRALDSFGLAAGQMPGRPGVWIEGRKICSVGIAVKHWISCHGLSLNVARDLALFEMVTPCGLAGVRATSLHRELDRDDIGMSAVKAAFGKAFCEIFSCDEQVRQCPNSHADTPDRIKTATI